MPVCGTAQRAAHHIHGAPQGCRKAYLSVCKQEVYRINEGTEQVLAWATPYSKDTIFPHLACTELKQKPKEKILQNVDLEAHQQVERSRRGSSL